VLPIVIVVVIIVLVASIIAYLLRRKAVAGKMDVEKGNKEIRDLEAREDDATLLENNDGAMSMEKDESEEVSPASVGEDESFIVTETEPMTPGDDDASIEENQEPSFDSQPPNQPGLLPGDERL